MEAQQMKSVIERALISFVGQATGDGNVGGTTIVCATLTTSPDFDGQQVVIASGAYAGQVRDIDGDTTTGTVTLTPAFGGQILSGVNFYILTGLPSLEELADIMGATFDTSTDSLEKLHDDHLSDITPTSQGRNRVKEISVTSAANVGDVTLATITTQPCIIESIVIHADAAQTVDLTSCGVFGGAAKVITFIAAADALQADLDAEDKQVAWTGAVRLAATKTIVISLVGTGATAVNLTVTITYRACVDGGYLA